MGNKIMSFATIGDAVGQKVRGVGYQGYRAQADRNNPNPNNWVNIGTGRMAVIFIMKMPKRLTLDACDANLKRLVEISKKAGENTFEQLTLDELKAATDDTLKSKLGKGGDAHDNGIVSANGVSLFYEADGNGKVSLEADEMNKATVTLFFNELIGFSGYFKSHKWTAEEASSYLIANRNDVERLLRCEAEIQARSVPDVITAHNVTMSRLHRLTKVKMEGKPLLEIDDKKRQLEAAIQNEKRFLTEAANAIFEKMMASDK